MFVCGICVCAVQVVCLMGVDLLRQQQRWKDGLQDLRTGFATLESQVRMVLISKGFRADPVFLKTFITLYVCVQGLRTGDMKAWRQHWNHQLYKALEHQYQVGLEGLNKNLPEINIDLVFK